MSELPPVYYAEFVEEPVSVPDRPHALRIGGYPALLAEVCELHDRLAKLEQQLSRHEQQIKSLDRDVYRLYEGDE